MPKPGPELVRTLVERLRRLDACAVADALDSFGLPGVLDGVGPLTGPARVAGRVVTVELAPADGEHPTRHLGTAAVAASGPDDVLVVAHQGRTDCAGWGGNLSRAARQQGVAGTIVHGAVRDVDEARELGYPVFGTGVTPRTARRRVCEVAWGTTVHLHGLSVTRGDFVVADSSGVVFVPEGDVERVLERAEAIARKEAAMAAALERGEPVTSVMGSDYEAMTAPVGG
jgi:regulator of RNase E activity RraA